MRTFASRVVVGAAWLTLWPMIAGAQTSAIAGLVKDSSGAVLPGVSVEVSSPALIEKTKTVISDVGGSGGLQQSPLQYRGSADAVQTIDGLRLNNLCANGAYSGVYWNDGSFQELSYVTGADSAEMGQGGIRINMVPKDGGNAFRGVVFGNYTPSTWSSDNCGSPAFGTACTQSNLAGDLTFNKNNY